MSVFFLRSWEINLDDAVTNLPRTASCVCMLTTALATTCIILSSSHNNVM